MALTLELPVDVDARLTEAARLRGLTREALASQMLTRNLGGPRAHEELIELLQGWIDDDDPAEQQETGEELIRSLDEDRPSSRKLFPPELKGITW